MNRIRKLTSEFLTNTRITSLFTMSGIGILKLIILLTIFTSCSSHKEFVIDFNRHDIGKYHTMVETSSYNTGGFNHSGGTHSTTVEFEYLGKSIYIDEAYYEYLPRFKKIANLIKKDWINTAKVKLLNIKETKENYYSHLFHRALISLWYANYKIASSEFKAVKEGDFAQISELLVIDCELEYFKANRLTIDTKKYIEKYQTLVNKYKNDSIMRKLVNNRVRFLRYMS